MRRACGFSVATALLLLLTGCPPAIYVTVSNQTHEVVKIESFDENGSGTFLPHFQLPPGESRRVVAAFRIVAHNSEGRLIGSLEPSRLGTSSEYFDRRTYTFYLTVREKGIFPVLPHEET